MKKFVAAAMSTVLLAGCSVFESDSDTNKPADLVDFTPTAKAHKIWAHKVGAQAPFGGSMMLALSGKQVFAGSVDGKVTAFDQATGKENWSTQLDISITGGVGAAFGKVAVAAGDGTVVVLNMKTGAELWRAKASSAVLTAPSIDFTSVVVHAGDGKVFGFDAKTGKQLWLYSDEVPVLTNQGVAPILTMGGSSYIGFASGKLAALDNNTGLPQWESLVALPQGRSEIDRMVDIDGKPVMAGSNVIAATLQGFIKSFDVKSGRAVWEAKTSTTKSLAFGFGNVYVSTTSGEVTAYKADTGIQVWQNAELLNRGLSSPVSVGNYIAVADKEGYLHFLSQVDGKFVARIKLSGPVTGPMQVKSGKLYVLDQSGKTTVLKVEKNPK